MSTSAGITALGDRLKGQREQNCKADTETQNQRPSFLFGGDLPEPPPMQRQVSKGQNQKRIGQPGVEISPLML